MQLEWPLSYYPFLRPDCILSVFWICLFVFFFVRQGTNLILPRYLAICVGVHFQILLLLWLLQVSCQCALLWNLTQQRAQYSFDWVGLQRGIKKIGDKKEMEKKSSRVIVVFYLWLKPWFPLEGYSYNTGTLRWLPQKWCFYENHKTLELVELRERWSWWEFAYSKPQISVSSWTRTGTIHPVTEAVLYPLFSSN